jgi:hypothetical protein
VTNNVALNTSCGMHTNHCQKLRDLNTYRKESVQITGQTLQTYWDYLDSCETANSADINTL